MSLNSRTLFCVLPAVVVLAIGASNAVGAEADPAAREPSASADAPDHARTGSYLAVSGGAALLDLDTSAAGANPRLVPVTDKDVASGSIGLRAGYRFHPRLAAELLWDYQTGWDFVAAADDAELSAWNLTANLKAFLTESAWQPYVVAGFGLGRREVDSRFVFFDYKTGETRKIDGADEAFVARVGGGLDVHVGESWTAGFEVVGVIGTGSLSGLDYATTTLVIGYRFLNP